MCFRALLHMATLPHNMWGEALRHSTWLKNRKSTRALRGKTPWQALYGARPDLAGLKRFGEKVWVHDPDESKLEPHAHEGPWIGFDVESRGDRVYCPGNKTVSIEHNLYFAVAERLEGRLWMCLLPKLRISIPRRAVSCAPTSDTTPCTTVAVVVSVVSVVVHVFLGGF